MKTVVQNYKSRSHVKHDHFSNPCLSFRFIGTRVIFVSSARVICSSTKNRHASFAACSNVLTVSDRSGIGDDLGVFLAPFQRPSTNTYDVLRRRSKLSKGVGRSAESTRLDSVRHAERTTSPVNFTGYGGEVDETPVARL